MKYLFKSLICKLKGHKPVYAGKCPYTGLTYHYCENCGGVSGEKTIEESKAE